MSNDFEVSNLLKMEIVVIKGDDFMDLRNYFAEEIRKVIKSVQAMVKVKINILVDLSYSKDCISLKIGINQIVMISFIAGIDYVTRVVHVVKITSLLNLFIEVISIIAFNLEEGTLLVYQTENVFIPPEVFNYSTLLNCQMRLMVLIFMMVEIIKNFQSFELSHFSLILCLF